MVLWKDLLAPQKFHSLVILRDLAPCVIVRPLTPADSCINYSHKHKKLYQFNVVFNFIIIIQLFK